MILPYYKTVNHNFWELVTTIGDIAAGLALPSSSRKTPNVLIGEHLTPSDVSIAQGKIEAVENFTYLESSINN